MLVKNFALLFWGHPVWSTLNRRTTVEAKSRTSLKLKLFVKLVFCWKPPSDCVGYLNMST